MSSTKSREVIWGGRIGAAKINAENARKRATEAARPIWKLEAALKCRSCKKGRYAPPVHMVRLTAEREITPYKWVASG